MKEGCLLKGITGGKKSAHRPRSVRAEHVQEILIQVFWGAREGGMGGKARCERKS